MNLGKIMNNNLEEKNITKRKGEKRFFSE